MAETRSINDPVLYGRGQQYHSLSDREDIVRQLGEELVRFMPVDAAGRVPIGEARAVVEIPRVNEKEVDVLVLCNRLHAMHEARKVTKVAGVVGLRER